MTEFLRQAPIVITVANLPPSARTDEVYMLTDAASYGDTTIGGGSIRALVFWDGSAWVWWLALGNATVPATVAIVAGVLTVPAGAGLITAQAETGVEDTIVTISGTVEGQTVTLRPDTGDTIHLANSGNLRIGPFGTFSMFSVADKATLINSDGSNLDALNLRNNA